MATRARNSVLWQPLAQAGAVPFLLIRHGQTAWNKERRFLGCTDVPLDEEGHHQAKLAATTLADLPLQAIHTSPLSRASQTAAAICKNRDHKLQFVNGLQELNQGELEGQPGAEVVERYPDFIQAWAIDPTDVRVPGGETMGECATRTISALEGILRRSQPGPPVAIVTHRIVLSCLICHALDIPLKHWRMIGQRNTAINWLSWMDGKIAVHRLNDIEHLGDSETPAVMPT